MYICSAGLRAGKSKAGERAGEKNRLPVCHTFFIATHFNKLT
jgi:hypothetical protein